MITRLFFYIVLFVSVIGCSELFGPDYCRITGKYKNYNCTSGYEPITEIINLDSFKHSCASYPMSGNYVLNNYLEFNDLLYDSTIDLGRYDSIEIERLYEVLDFDNRTLLISFLWTDNEGYGSPYQKTFVCKNYSEKKVYLRCQYERAGQCEGCCQEETFIGTWISVPKISDDYEVSFKIINVNPYDP